MTLVKVCGITNLPDARSAVGAGADALGFNFYRGSKRYLSPADARRIVEQVPPGVLCVGVFVGEAEAETVRRMVEASGVGAVQLHGDETPEFCREVSARLKNLPVIKALRVGADFRAEGVAHYETDAILLDAFSKEAWGGTGHTFDWRVAERVRELTPRLYLAGGLTQENVAAAIAAVGPYAVDVCSGVECAPGRKDAALVRNFIDEVRRVGP